jgi:hypothetical protein
MSPAPPSYNSTIIAQYGRTYLTSITPRPQSQHEIGLFSFQHQFPDMTAEQRHIQECDVIGRIACELDPIDRGCFLATSSSIFNKANQRIRYIRPRLEDEYGFCQGPMVFRKQYVGYTIVDNKRVSNIQEEEASMLAKERDLQYTTLNNRAIADVTVEHKEIPFVVREIDWIGYTLLEPRRETRASVSLDGRTVKVKLAITALKYLLRFGPSSDWQVKHALKYMEVALQRNHVLRIDLWGVPLFSEYRFVGRLGLMSSKPTHMVALGVYCCPLLHISKFDKQLQELEDRLRCRIDWDFAEVADINCQTTITFAAFLWKWACRLLAGDTVGRERRLRQLLDPSTGTTMFRQHLVKKLMPLYSNIRDERRRETAVQTLLNNLFRSSTTRVHEAFVNLTQLAANANTDMLSVEDENEDNGQDKALLCGLCLCNVPRVFWEDEELSRFTSHPYLRHDPVRRCNACIWTQVEDEIWFDALSLNEDGVERNVGR